MSKFVTFRDAYGMEVIVVFPKYVQHADFASNFQHWKPIRAGFVSKDLQCHGESISLRLMADAKLDTQLLKESLESRR